MAELIYQAENPRAGELAATYRARGARIDIVLAEGTQRQMGGAPAWAAIGAGLAEKRLREYLKETGRLPGTALMEAFQAEMQRRMAAFIAEPIRCPFRPVGLAEFERSLQDDQEQEPAGEAAGADGELRNGFIQLP